MPQDLINNDLYVNGKFAAKEMTLPSNVVANANVVAAADIDAVKLEHQYEKVLNQNGTAVADTRAIHLVYGATGSVVAFKAGSVVACTGNATITVDLKKNGTTMLSAVITLDNANTAYVAEAGTLAGTVLVAGDVLTVVVAVNAGTGALGTGLFAEVVLREDASP